MSDKRKNIFSKPLWRYWNYFHERTKNKNISYDDFFHLIRDEISQNNLFISKEEKMCHILLWDLWYSDAKKEIRHIFFEEKELKDFLLGVKLRYFDEIKQYIFNNGETNKGILLNSKLKSLEEQESKELKFALHVPYENEKNGFAFHIILLANGSFQFLWLHGEKSGCFDEYNYLRGKLDEENLSNLQLAFNVLSYINTYPDCVRKGVPSRFSDAEIKEGYVLEISDTILNNKSLLKTGERKISAHPRSAYFKVLKSDFYKPENRGKMILVRETFINGKAETLLTADNLSKFKKM